MVISMFIFGTDYSLRYNTLKDQERRKSILVCVLQQLPDIRKLTTCVRCGHTVPAARPLRWVQVQKLSTIMNAQVAFKKRHRRHRHEQLASGSKFLPTKLSSLPGTEKKIVIDRLVQVELWCNRSRQIY